MKLLGWYSALTLTFTIILGAYGFLISKQTPWTGMLALLILYFPPTLYIWLRLLKKQA